MGRNGSAARRRRKRLYRVNPQLPPELWHAIVARCGDPSLQRLASTSSLLRAFAHERMNRNADVLCHQMDWVWNACEALNKHWDRQWDVGLLNLCRMCYMKDLSLKDGHRFGYRSYLYDDDDDDDAKDALVGWSDPCQPACVEIDVDLDDMPASRPPVACNAAAWFCRGSDIAGYGQIKWICGACEQTLRLDDPERTLWPRVLADTTQPHVWSVCLWNAADMENYLLSSAIEHFAVPSALLHRVHFPSVRVTSGTDTQEGALAAGKHPIACLLEWARRDASVHFDINGFACMPSMWAWLPVGPIVRSRVEHVATYHSMAFLVVCCDRAHPTWGMIALVEVDESHSISWSRAADSPDALDEAYRHRSQAYDDCSLVEWLVRTRDR